MIYLTKDDLGIRKILEIIKSLQAKNLNYFKNTFNFYLGAHPPFPNSQMCYDSKKNDYKFVSNGIINQLNIIKFKDYIPGNEKDVICEHVFRYSVVEPYNVVIADANWILKLAQQTNQYNIEHNKEQAAEKFYSWYKRKIGFEIKAFKDILINKIINEEPIYKLF